MSYKSEVQTVNDPKWYTNTLRFKTEKEAQEYGLDLFSRWTATVAHRAAPSGDAVNYTFTGGRLKSLPQ